jgi:hypothetical protein
MTYSVANRMLKHCKPYNSSHRWLAVADLHTSPIIIADFQQNVSFSGLCPHPGRGRNADGGHPECGGGSERTNGPVVCAEGGADFISMQNKENLSILASFDTTPRHLHTGDSMDLPALI